MTRVTLLSYLRPCLCWGLALLLALALIIPLATTPAAADERPSAHQYKPRGHDDNDDDNDRDNNNNRHRHNNRNNNNNGGGGGGVFKIDQEAEQEAESADINQSFAVTSTGANSNQCAAQQGDAQSGNAQDLFDLAQVNSEADEVEAEEVGSTIDESPTSDTTCDQQVNQAGAANASTDAASASADSCYTASDGWYYCYWTGWGTYYWDPNVWNYKTGKWGDWIYWSPVSAVAKGALDAARGSLPLVTLGALALTGTAGILFRRYQGGA